MTERRLADLINYRISRASESLDEAKIMAETGHWNTCISRLYYACFYSVNALLIMHNLSSAKHTGVKSLFNKEFVKTGKVPVNISEIYNELFNLRHESDYEDFFQADKEYVNPLILQTKNFVTFIQNMINDK